MNPLRLISIGLMLFACHTTFGAEDQHAHGKNANFDKRLAGVSSPPTLQGNRAAAADRLRARIEGVQIDLDGVVGAPQSIYNRNGFLSAPANAREIRYPRTIGTSLDTGDDDPHRPIKEFLDENRELFGYSSEILNGPRKARDYVTDHSGMRTVAWQQELDGIPIFEAALYGHITRNGELLSLCCQFVPEPAKAADAGVPNRMTVELSPPISPQTAVAKAASNISEALRAEEVMAEDLLPEGTERKQRFTAPQLVGDATANLVWLPMDRNTMRLCWRVILTGKTSGALYQVLIDAESGEPQLRHCWTTYFQPASFRVFDSDSPTPLSPGWSSPDPVPTQPASVLQVDKPNTTSAASPNGWINDGDNRTIGNNVDAHLDILNLDPGYALAIVQPAQARPSGTDVGGELRFWFDTDLNQPPKPTPQGANPASVNQKAAVVNAFYWCNWMHDKLYDLGFNEAAGNFQQNNFGCGGTGGDPVLLDVQDGAEQNNEQTPPGPPLRNQNWNNTVPLDGGACRIELAVYNGPLSANPPEPERDADLDAEIILHEYTHGMVMRLVGHGNGITGNQTFALNEGWANFYALALLSKDQDAAGGNYAFGGYANRLWKPNTVALQANYYFGGASYPYTTDMGKNPLSLKDIDPAQSDGHPGIGRNPALLAYNVGNSYFQTSLDLWCVTLWEARAKLIAKYQFAIGNDLILRLVTDAMKLTPKDANFLQARDAIFLADRAYTGGANQKDLWEAFAKRGMGWSATCPAGLYYYPYGLFGESPPHEAFDLPPQGTQLWVYPPSSALAGGVYASPAIAPDGTIYFGVAYSENKLYALNPNGTSKGAPWPYSTTNTVYSSPAIGPDGTIYIGCYDTFLYALNPNGTLKWSYDCGGQIYSSPAIGPDGTIYFGTLDDLKVYALTPGPTSATPKWTRATGNTVYSSPAIGPDGTVYVGSMDNKVYALNPSNGADQQGWPYTTGGYIFSSPAVAADGTVYVGSADGKFYALNPNGTQKWFYNAGAAIRSSPAIGADGRIYFGCDNYKIYALNPTTGAKLWDYTAGSVISSSPAIAADGSILFGSDDGKVYALNSDGTPKGAPWPFYTGGAVFSSPVIGAEGTVYVGSVNGKLYALKNVAGLAQASWPMFRRNPQHTAYDWWHVGGGVEPGEAVRAILGIGIALFVGGDFHTINSVQYGGVAGWAAPSWVSLGSGFGAENGTVQALATSGNDLYVGGVFSSMNGVASPNFAKRTGITWSSVGSPNGPVFATAIAPNGDVYIGGSFTLVSATSANNIARRRAGAWQALGTGVNGPVQAIAIDASGLVYIGGQFTAAGGVAAANIAKWVDPTWSALSGGTDGSVASLSIGGGGADLYVGGFFVTVYNGATPLTANGVAKWASGAWSALGAGLQDRVQISAGQWTTVPAHAFALAASGATLYAGGDFTLAGGLDAARIARWTGTAWETMGAGVAGESSSVEAIALATDYVYIGGNLSTAGGAPAYGIARWKR